MKTRFFFAFFFVSGFCSLVYEVVWLRLSIAKFGVTTPMVSIVLSVFMAGLGLGSWLGGRVVRRMGHISAVTALRIYGVLELLIGISGLAVPWLLQAGYSLVRDAGSGAAWGSSLYYLTSGSWILLALLPWCTCMGATFPFAMAAIRGARSFSYLYLANVLGAVLGTLVPAFVLIELFGFRGTLHIASAMNGLLAIGVFALSFFLPGHERGITPTAQPAAQPNATSGTLALLFTTGICSMAMEVVWIRQFTVYLGNVVYAFASILAIYLLATFAGSVLYRGSKSKDSGTQGTMLWVCFGFVALLPLIFADPRFPSPEFETDIAIFLYSLLRAAFAIVPFSALAGYLTPLLVDRWSGGDPDRAGHAYAINVLGSIAGPVLAGFAILPWVGERWSLSIMAVPLLLIGFTSSYRAGKASARYLFAATVALSAMAITATNDYDTVYPQRRELRDYTASVIATGEGMHRRLLVNGIGMTRLTPITKMMSHLPLTILHRRPDNALVICFGMGTTFRSMLSWDIPTTAVDLVPSVPKMIGYYQPDGEALLHSPLAHVVIDDGRRFLERSSERFDVIVTDPPPPIGAPGSSLLYSEDFYAVVKPHLNERGIMQVWFPGGDDVTLAAIAKALRDSFPYVRAFESIEGWGVHFLASRVPLPITNSADLAAQLPPRAATDLIEWNAGSTPENMIADVLGREQSIDRMIAFAPAVPPITDDRPINEYFALRSAGLH